MSLVSNDVAMSRSQPLCELSLSLPFVCFDDAMWPLIKLSLGATSSQQAHKSVYPLIRRHSLWNSLTFLVISMRDLSLPPSFHVVYPFAIVVQNSFHSENSALGSQQSKQWQSWYIAHVARWHAPIRFVRLWNEAISKKTRLNKGNRWVVSIFGIPSCLLGRIALCAAKQVGAASHRPN